MTQNVLSAYDGLNAENKSLVNDFIFMLTTRQSDEDETLRVIRDAEKGIGLSEAFDNVDDLMVALNAED